VQNVVVPMGQSDVAKYRLRGLAMSLGSLVERSVCRELKDVGMLGPGVTHYSSRTREGEGGSNPRDEGQVI
jgi:hypothetical protein